MRIVILGPPGAGKGTQSSRLAHLFKVPHLSSGDMMRAAIADRTPIGIQVEGAMLRGDLLDDEIVTHAVLERLGRDDARLGFILDGFPRTVFQARALDTWLQERRLDAVVELRVPDATLLDRVAGRALQAAAAKTAVRVDDNAAALAKRLSDYQELTRPLVEHYGAKGLLLSVEGLLPIEDVTESIVHRLDGLPRPRNGGTLDDLNP